MFGIPVMFNAFLEYQGMWRNVMTAVPSRLSDRRIKALQPKEKDYVLTDGNGLLLRVRVNGSLL